MPVNLDTWNSLPANVQKVFEDNRDWFAQEIGRQFEAKDAGGLATAKEMGVEFITPSPEAVKEFFDYLKVVCLEGAAKLDAKGIRGTEMFNEQRRLVEVLGK